MEGFKPTDVWISLHINWISQNVEQVREHKGLDAKSDLTGNYRVPT